MSRRILDEATLRRLYLDEFLTTTEIGKMFGYSRDGVLWKIKKFNIPVRFHRVKGLDEKNLRLLYIDNQWSTIKIAKHLNCDDEAVRQQLKNYGISIRTKSEAGRVKVMTPEHLAKLKEGAAKINRGKIGPKHHAWKGGRYLDSYGYVIRRIDGKVHKEHRLVMESVLGRPLFPWEEVNHINGVKTDNQPDNLEVIYSEHKHKDWVRRQMYPDPPKCDTCGDYHFSYDPAYKDAKHLIQLK